MSFSTEQQKSIIISYTEDKDSLEMIAKRYNTYVNKIRRFLIKSNVPIRSFAESQKIALDVGRNEHPTKGRKRTNEEKKKISSSVSKAWDEFSDEKRESIREGAAVRWHQRTDEEKEEMSLAAKKGMQKAAMIGSKMEHFIQTDLESRSIPVIFHKRDLVKNTNLEVDIFVPSYNTAVEIDGPTHFLPIFGEDRLVKTMESDREKIGLLISAGYNILRLKCLSKSVSMAKSKKITDSIVEFLESIGSASGQYKEIEV
jgi:very-short-patch-repair endonuclease